MLSSIHPFGERSRNNSFRSTASAHIIGSTLGGAGLGLASGAIGLAVTALLSPSNGVRTVIVVVAAALGTLFEASRTERLLPTRSRQVDENWIQTYRGWVYGGGFGAELGFGISTIITTSLVHVLVVAMILHGSFVAAIAMGSLFGLVRGLTILATARVDSPEALRTFHRRLDDLRTPSRMLSVVALLLATAGSALNLGVL